MRTHYLESYGIVGLDATCDRPKESYTQTKWHSSSDIVIVDAGAWTYKANHPYLSIILESFGARNRTFLGSLCLLAIVKRESQTSVFAIGFDGYEVLFACSTHQIGTNCDDVAPPHPRMCGVHWCREPRKAPPAIPRECERAP